MELSNMLISKDCKLVSNQSKDGVVTMIWERYEEVLTVLFDEGFPSICYHFIDNERYSSLQGDLNTILNDDWEENDFKKLSPPQIENGKLKQAYVNNRFYLSFTISASPEQFDTWYDVCCRCIISEEEYLEKGEAEEMVRMYNSRFNARELVEMVKTLDKNIIRNYLIGKDWEPDEDFDDWFVYADTFSTSYPIEDMDSSMLFFKPAIKIFAGFWSDMNDVGVYDEGMSERFNCFIPNRKDGCLTNIIVLSLFRTTQDSLIKDLLKNGFTKVFHKEEILAPLSGQIGATFCTM